MHRLPTSLRRRTTGFTLMELLVVIAIILVLAVITLPVLDVVRQRGDKVKAVNVMRQLGTATGIFASQNDNLLPGEGSVSLNSWNYYSDPANSKAWCNALPRLMGMKGTADFATTPQAFYTKENLLFLPGAVYPTTNVRLIKPLFPIGINSKLQRRSPDGSKISPRLNNITNPGRTVLFLERGMPSEKKSLPVLSKGDGSPKGNATDFIARYSGQGVLCFVDGHAESFAATDIVNSAGRTPFPPIDVIWCKTPEEDPNAPSPN